MSKIATQKTLKQHKLAPHKRFGQNFLVNSNTAAAIASCANLTKDDTVVEVGVGLGALTNHLAKMANKVIGIEIDNGLVRYHKQENSLADNVKLIHADILKVEFLKISEQCGGLLKIVANLPYSISNPFIFKLIENRQYVGEVVVMLQKEVAERLMAPPSTKEYGIPTVLLGGCATIEKLMILKPHEFHPQPKIDSMVIRINFDKSRQENGDIQFFEFSHFQKIVRASFAKRRKTLINNLASNPVISLNDDKIRNRASMTEAIESAGLSASARAETLGLHDFIKLSREILRRVKDTEKK